MGNASVRWAIGIVVAAAFTTMLWLATRQPPLTIQGEVSADRVDISPRVAARIVTLKANVGEAVDKGAVLAELESPQLLASQLAAQAALAVARADLARVNSIRPETVASREADLNAAKADETLAQETYNRQIELSKTGNVPQAKVDEATRNLQLAMRKRESADAALQLATQGASKEERALAAAQAKQAEATLNQRDVDVAELVVRSPISGQITTRVAALGENFSAGAPLFAMIDIKDLWFTFNLREDLLGGLKIGDSFDVTVPALKSVSIPVRVTMINVQGQYAAWRATRATGDFDLRTFEVRAKPSQPIDGLRPGMSAIVAWANRGADVLVRRKIRPGFGLVFRREVGWLLRRPFLFGLTTVVPLVLVALLSAVFSAGLATRLPIAVLDLDGSDLSRAIIRTVDATPDTAVAVRVGDLAEGRSLILSGKIRGLLLLPLNLQRDVFAGRRPEVVFFYNTQTLTTGNLTARGVNAAVPAVAAGIRLSLRTEHGQPIEAAQSDILPVPVQTHPLFNPTLNYVFFLLTALIPSILQVIMVTASCYSVGMDVETRHRLRILRRLGGGLWPAMAGKILPYTIIFLLVLGLSDMLLMKGLDLPLRGHAWLLAIAGLLFVLACQFLGALLALLLKPLASAVSIATLLTAPAFGFMGIGFPRLGMNAFALGYGALLPGTWYLTARIDQTVRGTPVDLSWQPVLILAAFVIALAGLCAWRLESRGRLERSNSTIATTNPLAGATP